MLEKLELLAAKVDALRERLQQLEAENAQLREELAAAEELREAARKQVENILNKLRDVASQ
ncbi:MAG: hypothetical protein PWQ64_1126 [Desulfomicrobiaceae bacterium]|jgi:predicted nuclease with TOPRIM domain|nr:DUF904 domain-containing protein [Desulfomicrobiaceae bacterium]MBZ4648703.1 hypothetical protein [Desulfomicrobiaceae bacterium]MDI3492586.1 hypothetical protein [Desulfomicrobiaceae bacterium]MDK2873362.1 hypothetical protein [Desulfomicrobiaceae bacterium]HCF06039.1 DUF904 domain-containing protein [Desulfomicrobiaceae bacterium]